LGWASDPSPGNEGNKQILRDAALAGNRAMQGTKAGVKLPMNTNIYEATAGLSKASVVRFRETREKSNYFLDNNQSLY
jgi:hypothetical protein